jgi:hypothetical protein
MKRINIIARTLMVLSVLFLASCDIDGVENYGWRPGETLGVVGRNAVNLSATTGTRGINEPYYVEGHDRAKTYTWTVNGNAVTPARDGEFIFYTFPGPGTYTIRVTNGTHEGTRTVTVTQ